MNSFNETSLSKKGNSWRDGFLGGMFGTVIILIIFFLVMFSQPAKNQLNEFLSLFINEETVLPDSPTAIIAMDVSDVVEEVNPAVVSIIITQDVPIIEEYYINPFDGFFGGRSPFRLRIPQYRQNGTEKKEIGGGSGFFISSDGYLVTNAHVVLQKEAEYTVFTNDEQKYTAKVIALDEMLDIALLKIEANGTPYLEFGDSDSLRLGQAVIAIGNALGEFRNTVSTGVISGLSRSIMAGNGVGQSEVLENVIQTDAAINPGNSGGPLLNLGGKVVGVNVAIASGSQNIGFALPANSVKSSVESMKEYGKVIRPYLGVRYIPITPSIQETNKLPVDYGVLVMRGENPDELAVIPGSAAHKAGIEENDILLEIDGVQINQNHSLSSLISSKQVGQEVKIKILHNGEEKEIVVVLEEMPN